MPADLLFLSRLPGTCVEVSDTCIGTHLRYGLVVRIPGSHPGGPGSIPGNGKVNFARLDKAGVRPLRERAVH